MACPVNTVLASAATNGYFAPDPGAMQIIIAQLTCDLKAAIIAGGGGGESFESAATTFNDSFAYTFTHGLGAKPKSFMAVLINTSVDLAYAVGDEVLVEGVFNTSQGSPEFAVMANATTVMVALVQALPVDGGNTVLTQKTGGPNTPDFTKWKLKVYAAL